MRNLIRRAASITAASLIALTAVTGVMAAEQITFSDVPETHWAYQYIATAAEKGWVTGYGNNLFGPEDQVSYAELSTMLIRAFFPEALDNAEVTDDDAWYTAACTAAENLDLYVGVDIRTQHKNALLIEQSVSRYEMAQILYNTMRAAGAAVAPDLNTAQASTADWATIPTRYQAAVAATKEAGVITGIDDAGTFSGELYMSRAEAATIMTRMEMAMMNQATVDQNTPDAQGSTPSETDNEAESPIIPEGVEITTLPENVLIVS